LILVTGAAGNVGGHVVERLLARGARVVAADHRPERCIERFGTRVEARRLDFYDESTWGVAEGTSAMFLVRPPAISDVEESLNPFVDAARELGCRDVVFLSVAGAGENRFVPHRKVEDHLKVRGDDYVNLRPGFFAQNLATEYRDDILEDARIYVPAGEKPVNWIDVRDIAEAAAIILSDPLPHRSHDYTLTGPGAVSWDEVVDALTKATGREIRYEAASIPGYAAHLKRRGKPLGAIAVQTILHALLRYGQGDIDDPALEAIIGRPATTVQQYIREHSELWTPSPNPAAADS
jgi:uncharacterized protein YbjT (DUF2867 family)